MSDKPSFFAELQRRHVYKVGATYVVGGWLLVQVVTQVFPIFEVSALAQRIIVLVIVAGFPITLILTWLFDITSQGIVRTGELPVTGEAPGERRERRGADRKLNYILSGLLLAAVVYFAAERFGLVNGSRKTPTAAIDRNVKSIAVLPFENLSSDKENALLAPLPCEIASEQVLNMTFSPSRFKVMLSLRRVALVPTTFPLDKLKGSASFCRVNASIVVGSESCRQIPG